MRHIPLSEILNAPSLWRRHLINSISGYKSVNLVGTISPTGVSNLSLISSVVHLGATPPLQGFIMRPLTVERQTYEYIKNVGEYTINHVHLGFIDKAHYASAKFENSISEFDTCELTPEFIGDSKAPFVGESRIKMSVRYEDEYLIKQNNTIMIIGSIQEIYVDEACILEDGNLDLSQVDDVAVSGLETYYQVKKEKHFAFARVGQWPH